ncbi:RNA-guided endonuclease TnpB family protein [Anabaena sp. UHCC 0204]|uniref:RNA-guided endonuclease InsQ/TnpB family protein n=1 Tax=Anabaena sp. UHCC 0204 TaxID=2590009 RepID=UPI001447C533|nr:RNA-guided endonuclease TnpB family protein [Anabaena sp. UHCC 0204]MTJ08050.1 transposase [Anabaena sp. UHCC 0204]
MIIYEFKVKGKDIQYRAIDEAIRTSQFIRNKCLRYWMDNKGVSKYDLNKYCAVLASEFPFADELNSMARQSAAERSWSAIARFYDNCKKKVQGKKGFPKFKNNCRSVEYKTSGWKLSETRKAITFSDKKGIGTLKLKGTYDLNFYDIKQIKRVRLVRRADGYYAQFAIDVNIRVETQPTYQVVGLDLGLNYFIADSKDNVEECPKFYRKSEKQLNRANRKKSKKFSRERKKAKQRQSNNYHKARNRYARKHLRVSRQRKEYCKRLAYSVIQSNDLVAYEDLNIKGMVRNRHLAKSISDAGWFTFRQWLEYFGHKYGKVTIAVPPHNTSQNCSNCGQKVKKSLSTRTHICHHCGFVEDRDINASINILKLGLSTVGHTGTYATGDLPSWAIGVNLSSNGESMNVESPCL